MPHLKSWQASFLPDILQNILVHDYYYSRQAAICADSACASFLIYVASQKIRQMTILKEMTETYGIDIFAKSIIRNQENTDFIENLSDKTLDELFDFVKEKSASDLKMYSVLSNKSNESKSIFLALVDLEEDFISNIESFYVNHLTFGAEETAQEKMMQHA